MATKSESQVMESVVDHSSRMNTASVQAFLSLGRSLPSAGNAEQLLKLLVQCMVDAVAPADAGILYLADEDRQHLIAKASYGYAYDKVEHRLRPREGVPGQCYVAGKSLLFTSAEAVGAQAASWRPETLQWDLNMRQGLSPCLSMIAIPLSLSGRNLGVVVLEHYRQHRAFTETDRRHMEEFAPWASLVVDSAVTRLALKHVKRSYRNLLGEWISATEDERRIIAREIHDEVNQLLLSVKLNLESMEHLLPGGQPEVRSILELSRSRIDRVFDELHKLVLNLRPPELDDLGLPQALDWYIHNCSGCSKDGGLPISMQLKGLGRRRFAPVVETNLFRIAQEALSNVIKHAQASSAKVKLDFGKSKLVLVVEDDGVGFDADDFLRTSGNEKNLGLIGMNERAKLCGGTLRIDSAAERGTRVVVEVPIGSYDWGAY